MARERAASFPVKVLILGGTLFLGRHLAQSALARGDEVTLFNRGETNPELFPEVEQLRGDRDTGDVAALRGRTWDAVVDVPARVARWVRDATAALADSTPHYTFVSSASVYADHSGSTDETSPLAELPADAVEGDMEHYGASKAESERVAEAAMPGRVLYVRAGLIVGPFDPTGRFTYWVHRVARGGDVLAPEPRDQPVQFVHARDLADWILTMADRRETGVYNAVGPGEPLTMEALLGACGDEVGSDARLVWADEDFLVAQGVEVWSDLPLWLAPAANPSVAGFLSLDASKAMAQGLRFRPLERTIRETLEGAEPAPEAGLTPERESRLLAAWAAGRTSA
jgi:2'-hydroxyisoflavone reductase